MRAVKPDTITAPVRCEVAAFLVDSPEIVGARPETVVALLRRRWPALADDDIERAEDIALYLTEARRSPRQSDTEYLIEKARLMFGALAAANLTDKYGLAAR